MQNLEINYLYIETREKNVKYCLDNGQRLYETNIVRCNRIVKTDHFFNVYKNDDYGNEDLIATISSTFPHIIEYDHTKC